MENKNIYTINNITLEQLIVIQQALDIYSRIGMLQFQYMIPDDIRFSDKFNLYLNLDKIEKKLEEVKSLFVENHTDEEVKKLSGYQGASLGIGSLHVSKNAKIAYEIYKRISHKIWKDDDNIKNHNSYSVHSSNGLKLTDTTDVEIISENVRNVKIKKIFKK